MRINALKELRVLACDQTIRRNVFGQYEINSLLFGVWRRGDFPAVA
jgi:hypothetical protein